MPESPMILPQESRAHVKSAIDKSSLTGLRSPVDEPDPLDPGDETQRNFRYQHAYGVILLVQARLGHLPYRAIWCEQHEDLLGERTDGQFDGWQVKTRTPRNGAWKLLDEPLVHSIGRFCDLIDNFGDQIANLYFVSNLEFDEVGPTVKDQKRRARCPQPFLDSLVSCASSTSIAAPFDEAFVDLQAATGTGADRLFDVLKRLRLVHGPSRQDFDATVAFEHIGSLPECDGAPPPRLATIRDHLVMKIGEASSLKVTDGTRHIIPIATGQGNNPVLLAKRVSIDDLLHVVLSPEPTIPFKIRRDSGVVLDLASAPLAGSILRKKLQRGGLDDEQIEEFSDLARSAEYHLMREATRRPGQFLEFQADVEATVLYECRQAYLRAKRLPPPYGEELMIDIQDRLIRVAEGKPASVWRQEPACLIGVAALLADSCRVWFSERFPVDEA